ncbi:hypothetical protein CASFOL_028012 [Castilleja foliolosa]|uniref:DUF7806 domain-containing protein n=1 Tax=Castilleja foliolosa TaxID=1961234 RepID=A0ABD3CI30_9LAMI
MQSFCKSISNRVQMETLYSKLYDKYTKLKKERESEFDKLNYDQEVKFLNFVAAADEALKHYKSENEKLNGQVDELTRELELRASNDEQHIHYKKLLMEEKLKNNQLAEEIARLQKLEHKSMLSTEGTTTPSVDVDLDPIADRHDDDDKCSGPSSNVQQPACCQKKILSSGGDDTDTGSVDCVFQYLVELAVGLKFSPITQSNEIGVLAHHQSSGKLFVQSDEDNKFEWRSRIGVQCGVVGDI